MVIIPCTPSDRNKIWNYATWLEKSKIIRWSWGHDVDFSFPDSSHNMTFKVLAVILERVKYLVDKEDLGQELITLKTQAQRDDMIVFIIWDTQWMP